MLLWQNENQNGWTTSEYENKISIDSYIEVYGPDNEEFNCEFMRNKQDHLNDSRFEGLYNKEEGMTHYKKGYDAARKFVIETFNKDHFVKLKKSYNYTQSNNYWYNLGYMDGYNYYSHLVNENEIYEKTNDDEIMEDAYTKRLISSQK